MNYKKILYYGLVVVFALNCVFGMLFYIFTLLFPVEKKTETAVSTSISKEVSSGTTETSSVNGGADDIPQSTQGENNPDVDASAGGESIFDVQFEDGYQFPDLSGYDFIFLGDSIFDMNYSKTSMPRQLEVYTGAGVYNISKYGSCAGVGSNGYISLPNITEVFLSGKATEYGENQSINIDVERYSADQHKGKKTVIVINQCINDYIFATKISNPDDAYDVTTYEGALRTSVSRLKSAYPKATIVFMTPYYIGTNEQGNERNSYGFIMDDYINAMKNVAGEYGVLCFELRAYDFFANYRQSCLYDDLLHPNDMCSKTMARILCDFVQCNIG